MKSKVVTDIELRSHWYAHRADAIVVPCGAVLTPAAKDFIRENNIALKFDSMCGEGDFTKTPIPTENGRPVYTDAITGEKLYEKRENYTHLRGNMLVCKSHPQIELRGKLDTLMADIVQVQAFAQNEGETELISDLDEVLNYCRKLMAAEVKEEPFGQVHLLGMNSAELRYVSQNIKEKYGIDHPSPSYKHGSVCAILNRLRTSVRESELAAVRAFSDGRRMDIIEAFNRLSSCIYIIYCRKLAGYYVGGNGR